MCGKSPEEVLAMMGLSPDFEYANPQENIRLDFIHRTAGDADIYFVSNQRDSFAETECTFRIGGKTPELWRPDSGNIEKAPVYAEKDGRVAIPLSFDPAGSVFVVFRATTADADHIVAVKHSGAAGASSTHTLQIGKAVYETIHGADAVDITAKVAGMVKNGAADFPGGRRSARSHPYAPETPAGGICAGRQERGENCF